MNRRFAPLLCLVWMVGCGDEQAPSSTPTPQAVVETPTPISQALPSPSAGATVPCTPRAGASDALTGYGATSAAWSSHHRADPNHADFFLPALNDGEDRYTSVMCTPAGRVIAYHLNFQPLITVAAARQAFRSELPPDAVLVYDTVDAGCEHIQYRSVSLAHGFADSDPAGVADAAIILPDDPRQPSAVGTVFIDARVGLHETPAGC